MEELEIKTRTVEKQCRSCGGQFSGDETWCLGKWRSFKFCCDPCDEAQQAEAAKKEQEVRRWQLESEWREICPPLFRDTVVSKLPDREAYERVMAWEYGPIAPLPFGVTGSGKSRTAWNLAKREYFNERSVAVIDTAQLSQWGTIKMESPLNAVERTREWERKKLLIFDDPFKVRMSNYSGEGTAAEELLFSLLNVRSNCGLPTIITTDDRESVIRKKLSQNRRDSLLRRIKEFSELVEFHKS